MLGSFKSTDNKKCVPVLKYVQEDDGVWRSGVIFLTPRVLKYGSRWK